MQDITGKDIIVVAAACFVAWLIGKYIKRKNEREMKEYQENMMAQEAASDVEIKEAEIISDAGDEVE